MGRGSRPGERRGGRKRGTPNVVTVEAKAAIEMAFSGLGGVPALTDWARANPSVFYSRVWARLLPRELVAEVNADMTSRQEVRLELIERILSCVQPPSTVAELDCSEPTR